MNVNFAQKRFPEPHIQSTFNELIRDFLGNGSEKLQHLFVNWVCEVVQDLVQGSYVVLFIFLDVFSLLFQHFDDSFVVFVVVGEQAESGEMVVIPIEQIQMVPAVNASYQNVLNLIINHLFDISKNVRCEITYFVPAEY